MLGRRYLYETGDSVKENRSIISRFPVPRYTFPLVPDDPGFHGLLSPEDLRESNDPQAEKQVLLPAPSCPHSVSLPQTPAEICPSLSQNLLWCALEAYAKQELQNKVSILSREGENSKQVERAGSAQPALVGDLSPS